MAQKYKVMCPGEVHKGYAKFLFAVEIENGHPIALWQYCGNRDCRNWYKVEFSSIGVKLTEMPKNYHFDFERLPVLTDEYVAEAVNA